MVRHFLILENSETEFSVDPRNGRRNNTTRSSLEEIATGDTEMDIKILYEPDGDQLTERVATIERVDTRMRELRELDEKLDEELMKNNEE